MTNPVCFAQDFTVSESWQTREPPQGCERMWVLEKEHMVVGAGRGRIFYYCSDPQYKATAPAILARVKEKFGGAPTVNWKWRRGGELPTGSIVWYLEEDPEYEWKKGRG